MKARGSLESSAITNSATVAVLFIEHESKLIIYILDDRRTPAAVDGAVVGRCTLSHKRAQQ